MRTKIASKKPHFKKHPLTVAVQACCYTLLGGLPLANANPTGGQVVGGSGTISQSGTNTTINQATQNLAINWQTFNVQSNERVQFIQPNASAIALNRILSNNGSTIAGRIDANGKVILVNPNGIFFTSTASLNVGSLIASGLDINPGDFMNGKYVFNEISGTSGTVINQGLISASLGGNVVLIGKQVKNEGLIQANLGTVTLAAGKEAVLTFDNDGLLGVRVTKEILQSELGVDPAVINSGEIQAQGGRVLLTASQSQDIFTRAVNTNGLQPATSVVVNDDGTFTLGGGADVLNSGTINTSTTSPDQNVGRIVLIGQNVTSSGTLKADAQSGNGGEIELHARDMTLLTQNSVTSARSEAGGQGGIVKVLGDRVGLFDQSILDVSGANGGGQALIGGDFQGKNPNIRNSSATIIRPGASVYADALSSGNGGKVIVWSDGYTYFLGKILSRGGTFQGDGGLVETSGKGFLQFAGYVDSTASNGESGLLLLDPKNLTIQATGSNNLDLDGNQVSFDEPSDGSDSTISASVLVTALNGSNITLQANSDITFNVDVLSTGTNNLTLRAGRSIVLASNVDVSLNSGNFRATINDSGASPGLTSGAPDRATGPAEFTMNAGASIATNGGDISISTGTFAGDIGDITLGVLNTSVQGADPSGVIPGGSITVTNSTGNIDVNGAIAANGEGWLSGAPASTNGGDGGTIALTANSGTIELALTGNIASNGGNAGGSGNDGGDGGPVTLSADYINVLGAITSNGGNRTGTGNGDINGSGGTITFNVVTDLTVAANISAVRGTNGTSGTNGDITFNGTGNANVFNINNAIALAAASVTINGIGGIDRLVRGGTATNNTWEITGPNTGNLVFNGNTITFNDVQSLTGGILVDNFTFTSGSLDGLLDGGGGSTDILALTTGIDVQLHSPAGGLANQGGLLNVTGIETITDNSAAPNTVYADNTANSWTIDATGTTVAPTAGADTENTVRLENFTQLNGGTGIDTFALSTAYSGTINGGAGNDIFNINSGATITGNVNGEAGNDTFNISANVSGAGALNGGEDNDTFNVDTANLTITTLSGGNGSDAFNINATGTTITSLVGGNDTAVDTLRGPDVANIWSVGTGGSGTLNSTIAFSQMESLVGALNQNDTFNFTVIPAAALVTVDGRGHTTGDTVGFSGVTGTVDITIGATGFNNIEQFTGNGTGTLTGANVANAWDITGTNSGTLNLTTTFSGFNNITGGTNTDTFTLGAGGSVTGLIDGAGGGNTLIGRDAANIWTITGANSGNVADATTYATFTNIQSLTGALTQNDTFNFGVTPAVALITVDGRGQSTSDTVSFAGVTGAVSVTIGAAGFDGIEQFTGNDTNSTLTGENNANTWTVTGMHTGSVDGIGFSGFTALVGGSNDDTFNFTVTPTLAGLTVNGSGNAAGGDSVNVSAITGAVSVQLGPTGFSNIESISGNNTDSTLRGADIANIWTISGAHAGSVGGTAFTGFTALVGAATQNDTFNFNVQPAIAAVSIDGQGQASADTVSFATLTDQTVSVQLGATGFSNIEQYTGNNTDSTLFADNTTNTWNLTGQNDGTLNTISFINFNNLVGGNSTDTFYINGGQLTGLINGGAGANTLNILSTNNTTIRLLDLAPAGAINNPANTFTVLQVGTLNGNSNYDHTLAPIISNPTSTTTSWNINGLNAGSVNSIGLIAAFTGFRNLAGTTVNDTFSLTSSSVQELVTGVITGGGQFAGGEDVLNLIGMTGGAANVTVRLGNTPTTGQLNVNGIERIEGNNASSIVADNGTNDWTITGANDGTVRLNVGPTSELITFNNFNTLRGGSGNDNFQILFNGSITASIAGGTQVTQDTIDYSAQSTVTVDFGTGAFNGIAEIEAVRGNGTNSTLNGPTGNADWQLTGVNTGSVTDGPGFTLGFEGFNYLVGGAGNDTFLITNGSLLNVATNAPGLIQGGSGTNTVNVELTGAGTSSGQINYVGSAGNADTINFNNTSTNAYEASYTPAVGGYEQLSYSYANLGAGVNTSLVLNYQNVGTIVSRQAVNNFTVNGSAQGESIQLGSDTFRVGGFTPVSYFNVTNLTVNAQGGVDNINLTDVNLGGGSLTLTAETVTGNNLSASGLILDNVGQFGSAGAQITTTIDALRLINNAGAVYINETNGLTLNATGVNTGIFTIAGTTILDAGDGGSLTLNNVLNDFDVIDTANGVNAASLILHDVDRIEGGNIMASSIILNTADGIGIASSPLSTTTANLIVNNSSTGDVYISNNGAATIGISTFGNIGFSNSGNVVIERLYTNGSGSNYLDRSQYRNVNLSVSGSVQGSPLHSIYTAPDITAFDLTVLLQGNFGFGTRARPMSLSVVDTFTYVGGQGFVHYFGGQPPREIITVGDLVTFSTLDALTGLQLLEVESLDEFDPAIFTEVRNYYYEDVAIMMPADQRLDGSDDDEKEEEKEGKL